MDDELDHVTPHSPNKKKVSAALYFLQLLHSFCFSNVCFAVDLPCLKLPHMEIMMCG